MLPYRDLYDKSRALTDVFTGMDIPEIFSDTRIAALSKDTRARTMDIIILSKKFIAYKYLQQLSEILTAHYQLDKLLIKPVFIDMVLKQDFLDEYKVSVIETIASIVPVMRYVFADSSWVLNQDDVDITLYNNIKMLYDEKRLIHGIECQFASELGTVVHVHLHVVEREEIEETPRTVIVTTPPKTTVKKEDDLIFGKRIKIAADKIADISPEGGRFAIRGEVVSCEFRQLKNDRTLCLFNVYDKTSTLTCKCFLTPAKAETVISRVKVGSFVLIEGLAGFDTFDQDLNMKINSIMLSSEDKDEEILDNAPVKRVELHAHTKMSAKDGMTDAKSLVNCAIKWGHKAIAITDHAVVQSFPEAFTTKMRAKSDIKIIYGVEGYLLNDIHRKTEFPDKEYVVFDVETTGLSPVECELIEIGAVKIRNGELVDEFSELIKPVTPISEHITSINGIDNDMVENAPPAHEVLARFRDFVGKATLVAHNAKFDLSFINEHGKRYNITFPKKSVDTLVLARKHLNNLPKHGLDAIAKYYGVANEQHHRALNDAKVCAGIFLELFKEEHGVTEVIEEWGKLRPYHIIILAKNQVGLQNLYRLVSISHMEYFKTRPRILKSVLYKYREGLIIGGACEQGEIYQAILNGKSQAHLDKIAELYDYYEIQPLGNNRFMVDKGKVPDVNALKAINRKIVDLGYKHRKLTVATGDVHFLNPADEVYRRIIMKGQGFDDADNQAPLYMRTTEQMLAEFEYFDLPEAYNLVVDNPNKIAEKIEDLRPVPRGMFAPKLENSETIIRDMANERAKQIYGEKLPLLVQERLDKELNSIINNGFSVMYLIAHKLVKKSMDDGYKVGSRGSVGSSFAAFLTGITEVNSLPPHYVCPNCKKSEFILDGSFSSGCDMADKMCPDCNVMFIKDGHDIPFETFLGFNGEKAPDIDLNFSGEYQANAHKYTEELFGKGQVFRAGTISGIAEKTAFGFVKKYYEGREQYVTKAEINRLAKRLEGIKQTTGQHPGGIVVVPQGHDITEFTPIQYPADKTEAGTVTTHFDFHSIDENLLKLDILGHDDPTVIRMLEDLTGVPSDSIPLDEPRTMSLFTSTEALGVTPEQINSAVGTFGVPEFGTKFVREMLVDTKPRGLADLIRISGLSHGTDVWLNNAKDLVKSGTCTLSECICTRDDIMVYLIHKGLPSLDAFSIMESVRKGKGLNAGWEELMRQNDVPQWYINSCNKIKYMFPKAHAAAYVTMAFRIAYYKIAHPLEFYIAYFTVRADVFDYEMMATGQAGVKRAIAGLEEKGKNTTQREKDTLTILEMCNEMYARGFEFLPIDIEKSEATKFLRVGDCILPPLNSLVGLGASAAQQVVEARKSGPFRTQEDFSIRAKINKTTLELFAKLNLFGDLPESDQLSLF